MAVRSSACLEASLAIALRLSYYERFNLTVRTDEKIRWIFSLDDMFRNLLCCQITFSKLEFDVLHCYAVKVRVANEMYPAKEKDESSDIVEDEILLLIVIRKTSACDLSTFEQEKSSIQDNNSPSYCLYCKFV